MRKETLKKIWRIFPYVWTGLGMLLCIWYQIVPGTWILEADMASDMVLSNHLNQTHTIISPDWFYATELKVFEIQWFQRIALLLIPNNWHAARVLSAVLIYVLFIALILFLGRCIGLEKYAPWMTAILMWPFGRWYLIYGIYGAYYLIYMMFSVAATGVLLRLCGMERPRGRKQQARVCLLYLAGLFCSIASGLNGVKQTMVFFGPLLLTGVVLLFLAGNRKKSTTLSELWADCRFECLFLLNAAVFTAANVAGYLLNLKVLSDRYSYVAYDDLVFADRRPQQFLEILLDFLCQFGFIPNVKVLSGRGIAGALGLVFAAVLVICTVRIHRHFSSLKPGAQAVVLIFDFSFLLDAIVYCLIGNYRVYYWLPLFPFAIAVIVLELKTGCFSLRCLRHWILAAIALMLPVLSYGSIKQETESPMFAKYGLREVTDFLLENGYTEGYSSFWSGTVIREMSSNKIQMWALYNVNTNVVVYDWLQEKEKKETEPEGKCFLIFNEYRDGSREESALLRYGNGKLVYDDGVYFVYEFESPANLYRAADLYLESLQ